MNDHLLFVLTPARDRLLTRNFQCGKDVPKVVDKNLDADIINTYNNFLAVKNRPKSARGRKAIKSTNKT